MTEEERLGIVYEAARLYYEEHLTKTQIANRLKVSNTQANRYLKEAMAASLVSIKLVPPRIKTLEFALTYRFKCLKEVIVVPLSGDARAQLARLGEVSASYFDTVISHIEVEQPGKRVRVCVSGGNTMYEVVRALPDKARNIEISPAALIGRGPFIPEHIDPLVLITDLWRKSGRPPKSAYYATVPPFDNCPPAKIVKENEVLKKQPRVQTVWKKMHQFDVLFASIGCFKTAQPRTLLDLLADTGITHTTLERDGIVGDIAYSMLDENGNPKHPSQAKGELFITLGVKYLQTASRNYPRRRVVLIAGQGKEEGITAALRGGTCNVLIVDEAAAEKVLSLSAADGPPPSGGR
jgi:deoxyribonucleoside regulator